MDDLRAEIIKKIAELRIIIAKDRQKEGVK